MDQHSPTPCYRAARPSTQAIRTLLHRLTTTSEARFFGACVTVASTSGRLKCRRNDAIANPYSHGLAHAAPTATFTPLQRLLLLLLLQQRRRRARGGVHRHRDRALLRLRARSFHVLGKILIRIVARFHREHGSQHHSFRSASVNGMMRSTLPLES